MGWLRLAQGCEARQDESMAMESKRVEVLGMGLQATDYAGGVKLLEELAHGGKDIGAGSVVGINGNSSCAEGWLVD